jgi:hypothetical protein
MRYTSIQAIDFALIYFDNVIYTAPRNIINIKAENTDIFPEAIGRLHFLG